MPRLPDGLQLLVKLILIGGEGTEEKTTSRTVFYNSGEGTKGWKIIPEQSVMSTVSEPHIPQRPNNNSFSLLWAGESSPLLVRVGSLSGSWECELTWSSHKVSRGLRSDCKIPGINNEDFKKDPIFYCVAVGWIIKLIWVNGVRERGKKKSHLKFPFNAGVIFPHGEITDYCTDLRDWTPLKPHTRSARLLGDAHVWGCHFWRSRS